MTAIWESIDKNENKDELPVIIPLLFYHGQASWNVGNTFAEIVTDYQDLPGEIQKHVPNFEYLFFDISKYSDEEILGHAYLQAFLTILRDVLGDGLKFEQSLFRTLEYLNDLKNQTNALGYLNTMFKYIFSVRQDMTTKEYEKVLKRVEIAYPEGSGVVMTLAEIFRKEGMELGVEKGIELGMEKGIEKVVRKSLMKRLAISDIAEITGLTENEIEQIRIKMLE